MMHQAPLFVLDKEGRQSIFVLDELKYANDAAMKCQMRIRQLERHIADLTQMLTDQKLMYAKEIRRLNSKLQEMWKDAGEEVYFSTPPSSPSNPHLPPGPPPSPVS